MSTEVARRLLDGLVDDAELFPPGNRPMPQALRTYREIVTGPHRALLGRFLCPASRLAEMTFQLGPNERIPLVLVMDTGALALPKALGFVAGDRRLRLKAVEIPLPPGADQSAEAHATLHALHRLPHRVVAYLELPRVSGWRDALSLITARGRGVKLRTGGLAADVFPTEDEVASFVKACVEHDAAFKCTAGLHHAVRHRDTSTGFEHQGFLNILLATCRAVTGARQDDLARLLAEQDPAALLAELGTVTDATAAAARRHFVGYGSCGFTEAVEDLTALGLLHKQPESDEAKERV